MRFRLLSVLSLVGTAAAIVAGQSPSRASSLTVHEWGTFTSIAGEDGRAVSWLPQAGPTDLPCFVERSSFNIKGSLRGTVRMETPVLYFYSADDVTVNVGVRFRQGAITEWYPRAVVGMPAGANLEGTIAAAFSGMAPPPACR